MIATHTHSPSWKWITFLTLALAGAAAGCRHRGEVHGPGRTAADAIERIAGHMEHLFEEVDVTEDQRRTIRAAVEPLVERARQLHTTREPLRDGFHAEWGREAMDLERLHGLLDAETEKWVPLLHDATAALATVHGVLTADQRAQLGDRFGHRGRD